jgi:hypothetical protein
VQAGIVEVVTDEKRFQQYKSDQYNAHFPRVMQLFEEAGVRVRTIPFDRDGE